MKYFLVLLVSALCYLQYAFWYSSGGFISAYHQRKKLFELQHAHGQLLAKNEHLQSDVDDLKHGTEALEAYARNDLGMIKPGETFYRVLEGHQPEKNKATPPLAIHKEKSHP